jgi:hypothetical protein
MIRDVNFFVILPMDMNMSEAHVNCALVRRQQLTVVFFPPESRRALLLLQPAQLLQPTVLKPAAVWQHARIQGLGVLSPIPVLILSAPGLFQLTQQFVPGTALGYRQIRQELWSAVVPPARNVNMPVIRTLSLQEAIQRSDQSA